MRFLAASILATLALLSGCTGETPSSLIESARESLAKGDPNAAGIHLRAALKQDPDSAEARFLFGKLLLDSGDPAAAAVELRKALDLKYKAEAVQPELARALLSQGRFTAVIDEFDAADVDDASARADLKNSVASAYMSIGQLAQAEQALRSALQAEPDHPGALVSQVNLLARRGDFGGAFAQMDKVLERHPRSAHAWRVRGDLLLLLKDDLAGAYDAYRKAIELDPRNIDGHVGAITILMRRADEASIDKQLAKLREVAPRSPQTAYFEAQLAFKRRDFKRAQALLQELLRAAPGDPRVTMLAGATELEVGTLVQAEALLRRAVQMTDGQPMARQLLAQTLLRSGQPAAATDTLKPLLEKQPDTATLSLAAQAALMKGDVTQANMLFDRVAKLDPKDMQSRTALALAAIRRGDDASGLEQLRVTASADQGATADLALISVHLTRRDFVAALSAVDALAKKAPNQAFASNLRGRVLLLSGDKIEARKSFEQALSVDPAYFAAVSGLAALDLAERTPSLARERYEAFIRNNPKHVQAILALADLSAQTGGSVAEVTKLIEGAIQAAPADTASRLKLVDHLLRSQEPRQALNAAQVAAEALPNKPELLDALGRAQLAAGEGNQAVSTFSSLATLLPLSPRPLLGLAGAYAAINNSNSARQSLSRALAIAPNLLEAQERLIRIDLADGRSKEALSTARSVQKQRPREAIGYMLEGDVEDARKNPAAAVAAYRMAVKVAPTPEAAVRLHVALVKSGKEAEADRFARSWMEGHPRDTLFLLNLANLALEQREFALAEARYQDVLKLDQNSPLALSSLAWAMAMQKKVGAVAYAERASRLRPGDATTTAALIFALVQEGKFERAIELQKSLLSKRPQAHFDRLKLARIYLQAGRKSEAETELLALAKLGDDFRGQSEVASLLKLIRR